MAGISSTSNFGFADDQLVGSGTGLIERGVKVFKIGTFTDAYGRTKTWTGDDLDKAVTHFKELRESNILPNVPVRKDHTSSIKDVVAYFTDIRREGNFLVSDWEWVDDHAKMSWDNKQLRNRSIEIGKYTTNDGVQYDPVVVGLAFVDLPAVEGLYRIATGEDMTTKTKTPDEIAAEAKAVADAVAAAEVIAAAEAAATAEAAAAAAIADAKVITDNLNKVADDALAAADEAAKAAGRELVSAHGRHASPFQFRLDSISDEADFTKVQQHITSLETARDESVQSYRAEFLDGLVASKVLPGPQAEHFRKLVPTMTPDGFENFKLGFEGMAPANLFGRHDLGTGSTTGGSTLDDAKTERISVLEGIVRTHKFRGATQEQLNKMSSYVELQTLKSTDS